MSFSAVAIGVGSAVAGAAVSSALAPSPSSASGAAGAADPFASQRGQYQTMLANLINNPSSITSQPGYQFGLTTGVNQVQGSAAAKGMLNSGNTLAGIDQFSQSYAATQLQNQELLLAQLAGANIGSPGTAGQILNSQNQTNQQSASALGNAVGGAINTGLTNASNNGFFTGAGSYPVSGSSGYSNQESFDPGSWGYSG